MIIFLLGYCVGHKLQKIIFFDVIVQNFQEHPKCQGCSCLLFPKSVSAILLPKDILGLSGK